MNNEKKLIVTSLIDAYEKPTDDFLKKDDYDYVIVIDKDIPIKSWRKRVIFFDKDIELSPAKKQRYIKTHLFEYFQEYDVICYVDANTSINEKLYEHIESNKDKPITFKKHNDRTCIYEEITACQKCGKITKQMGDMLRERYKKENYPQNNGLYENNIIVFRPENEDVKKLFRLWWNEIYKYSHRDQFSLNYVIWKNKLEYIINETQTKNFPAKKHIKQNKNGSVAGAAIGRAGNQMFCTVAAMTYAKRTGRDFIGMVKTNNKRDYPEDVEKTIMRKVKYTNNIQLNNFKVFGTGSWLCSGFPNTDVKNVYFNDYFQDVRCIDKEISYELFKPYESIINTIKELYGDLSDYVCVNVRRGDYLNLTGIGFNVYSKEEIDKIIETYFPNDKILFVSDDIDWCKKNFIGDRYLFADKPYKCKPEIDLYLQTQCKANVISNSTFSWWGAFLNEHAEKVVCHWPWFKKGHINPMEHILPDNWIKFEYKNGK